MGRFFRHLLFSYKSFISNATANLFVCCVHLALHTLHLCAHWQRLNCTVITSCFRLFVVIRNMYTLRVRYSHSKL